MGYKCSFMDNAAYTAQDVNEAIGRIAGDGAAFSNTGDTLSDLNTALAGIVGSGTQLCGCEVTKTGDVYKIGAGTCFMDDGSQITFDSDGYEFTPEEGVKNYVYVKRNAVNNSIDVVISQTAGSGDYVPLAEIAADGSVSDTRKFATAKVVLKSSQSIPTRKFHMQKNFSPYDTTFELNAGYSDWKYIIWEVQNQPWARAANLSDGQIHGVPIINSVSSSATQMDVKKDGSKVIFSCPGYDTADFTFELR